MLDLERAWIVACSRCANEGISYEEESDLAHVELRGDGWTRDATGRTYCPDCSKETKK